MSKAIVLPAKEKIDKLDLVAREYGSALSTNDSPFLSTFTLAVGMGQLRELLTPDVMAPIMEMMNSPLGFLTDRSGKPNWKGETKPPYKVEEVRDCVIEATLRGFYIVGNEFNIIAGRFYGAKSGFQRKVKQYPGLTDLKDFYEVPRVIAEKGAIVKCRASWKLNGAEDSIEREFAVKGDSYATSDSYIGKAERKLMAAVHSKLTGQHSPEGDVTDAEFIDVTPAATTPAEAPSTEALAGKRQAKPATEAKTESVPAADKPDEKLSEKAEKEAIVAKIVAKKNTAGVPMADLLTAMKSGFPSVPTDLNDIYLLDLATLNEVLSSIDGLLDYAKKQAAKRKQN